ncbi:hypothetical protein FG386_003107 [Cryptosporidium ryanae]|uniref:uncharacterized protein n=1 Tax=Cryptosporidium ryanae TaxID=515981 RepID=UPI00351A46A9|nr:hypothetical protein FG386_003107 [Cryptosporidium ryanae]
MRISLSAILLLLLLKNVLLIKKIKCMNTGRYVLFNGLNLASNLFPEKKLEFIQNNNDSSENDNILSSFPSPIKNPEKCGRRGRISSNICDPYKLLSAEEGDYIDTLIEDIKNNQVIKCGSSMSGYNIGVAILPPTMGDGGNIANQLLKSWSLSSYECNNDIIFVYLASENRAIVRWGVSVEPALNIVMYPELISEIDSVLREKSLGPAIYSGISTIRRELKENIGPPRRLPQLLVLGIIGGLTALGFGALVVSAISESRPKKSSSKSGRRIEAQELLHRIQLMVKNGSIDRDICPITLIDLNRTGVPFVVCNKGYKYEAKSYLEWMRINNCGPETDPITKAIEKNDFILSKREDVLPENRKIPVRLYLESLLKIYPDIISEQNIKNFLKNVNERWILP